MSKIIIQSVDNGFLITGNILENIDKRMRLHLKRSFKAEEVENGFLISAEEKENLLSSLNDYFLKKGISLGLDKEANAELSRMYQEEQDFYNFSQKCKKIWGNDVDNDEFREFCNVLEEKMVRKLYPLQLLSAYHLAFSQNSCNFSVPGAGKTSIVYGAYSYLKSLNKSNSKFVNKILVIGPLSSFGPWENEYRECFGLLPIVKRISGGGSTNTEKKRYFYSSNPADITLISYQGIITQKENIEYFLKNNNVMVILDEAHKIKNTDGGQIAESVLSLAKWAKGRVVLTGTQAPNGYRDLYNLFKFIWPNKDIISFSLNQLDDMTNTKNDPRVNILVKNISPYFVRIKKKDLGLPEKTENPPIVVSMDRTQKLIYEKIEAKVIKSLMGDDDTGVSFISDMKKAKVIRLMQAASNPYLLLKPLKDNYYYNTTSDVLDESDVEIISALKLYEKNKIIPPKFKKAYELISDLVSKGEKIIVWAIYIDTIEQFAEYLNSKKINSKILYGKTKIENENLDSEIETRESIVRTFHKDESDFKVIIANPFAVAESISLHKACHNAIYLERNFDAARYVQSKDRIHRYGLNMDTITNYYYLNTRNSIDIVIDKRLQEKEEVMMKITESADIPLFSVLDEDVDKSDIKALIEDYVKRNK